MSHHPPPQWRTFEQIVDAMGQSDSALSQAPSPTTHAGSASGSSSRPLSDQAIDSTQNTARKRPRRGDATTERASKRRQASGLTNGGPEPDPEHETVDLSMDEQATLGAQTQSLIESQKLESEDDDRPKPMGQRNCIICLDNFTNVTTTACGHLFCHECLTQALKAGQLTSERRLGSCPVCRKTLKPTTKGHVIPLVFMTKGKKRK